jgi:hypothetical protein
MESDSDYEVEDTVLLHVEAAGVIHEDIVAINPDQISFIQVDSENPLVQLGGQVYSGQYEDTVATSLFFTQTENPLSADDTATDPVFGRHVPVNVEFLDSTRKKLKLKRVFLKPKQQLKTSTAVGSTVIPATTGNKDPTSFNPVYNSVSDGLINSQVNNSTVVS